MRKILEKILEIVFPKKCLICSSGSNYLCEDCFSLIEIATHYYCPFCEKPSSFGKTCSSCQRNHYLDGLIFAADYNQAILQRVIHSFKYPPYLIELKNSLSLLIISHFKLSNNKFFENFSDFIFVPVPSHYSKIKKRGFDHTKELTQTLVKALKAKYCLDLVTKKRKTVPQIQLSKEERQSNLLGAFEINKNINFSVKNKNFLIIDDVFTTGATMDEIAKILKQNGAKKVWGLCVAREFKTNHSK